MKRRFIFPSVLRWLLLLTAFLCYDASTFAHDEDCDFEVDNICYNFISGKTDEVAVTYRWCDYGWRSDDYSSHYTGSLIIPEVVTHNATTYKVTAVGVDAFYECYGLTSVSLPNSITSIESYAFSDCNQLNSIIMSQETKSIGASAFSGCINLSSINIPSGVTSIGSSAFDDCRKLYSITIPNTVNYIGAKAFRGSGWYYNQPDGMVYAGLVAYEYKGTMPQNTEIIIKEGTKGLAAQVFYNCRNLTSITIPNSMTNIGNSAFYGCTGLTSVTIPNSVTSIGNTAFYGCSGLTSITIGNSVTSIGDYAFQNCNCLTSVTIPNSVTSIGYSAFSGCRGLTKVIVPNIAAWCGISFRDYSANPLSIAKHLYSNETIEITNLIIPNSVTSIGSYTFYNSSGLESVIIPSSVASIGNSAFSGCYFASSAFINNSSLTSSNYWGATLCDEETSDGLMIKNNAVVKCRPWAISVTIPGNVTSIGNDAFSNCSNLTFVTIPNSVISIGDYAYSDCNCLTSVTIPNSVTSIGDYAFKSCSGLKSIKVEAGNTQYDSRNDCNAIIETASNKLIVGCMNTIIPNSVTSILYYAFSGCSGLTSVIIPNSVKSIGSYAFSSCSALTDVWCCAKDVPSTNSYSFSNTPIASATLHVPITSLEKYKQNSPWSSFGTIVAISNIEFADDNVKALCVANWDTDNDGELNEAEAAVVTDLGKIFRGNKQIHSFEELQYFVGLTSIGDNAFRGCSSLTSIIIPKNVTHISEDAFNGCSGLASINIPKKVTSIGAYAFSNCSVLTEFWCYAEALPSTDEDIFDGTNIGTATLYVPKISLEAYKTTAPWSGFRSIVPIEGYTTYNINDEMASLNIEKEESGCIVDYTHNFNGEWEALYLPFAIDYDAIKADFDLAEIDGVVQNDDNNDGIVDFTVLSIIGFKEQKTEPNMLYLIRAKHAGEQTIHFGDITVYPTESVSLESSSISTRYEFTGSYNMLDASALTERYTIQNGELVKGASSLAPCRWYMTATAKRGSLNLPNKIRIMPVEDVITGIDELRDEQGSTIVNLAGQRLSKPAKGINIVGGKKVLVK